MQPFKTGEAPWAFTSLSSAQCAALVETRFTGAAAARSELLTACKAGATR
jgi:hypothetical protein